MAETVKDTERAQAGVRLLSALLVTVYAPILAWAGQLPAELATIMAIHGVAFLGVALLLRWAVIRWPGHYPARRLLAMLNDYAALGFHLILGGRALLPVYAVVLWMTIGYGVRYGSRYLVAATAAALLDLVVVASLTPYWREQPYVTVMLFLTTLIVPAYTYFLLRSNERSHAREREATQAKTRLLAQASHDLRQPIHSIALFADCLRDENLNGHQRHLVDSIDRSLHSVSHLFRSILDSYTLDSGKLEPRIEAVRVGDVLDAVANVIQLEQDMEIYTSGATNIFRYPELSDKQSAQEIISAFEEKQQLSELVTQTLSSDSKGIQVYIGNETPVQNMKDCSVVTATYELGEGMQGTIGIIGPKRMDYERVMDTLKTLQTELDTIFHKKE